MQEVSRIYAFSLGNGHTMGYEVSEEAAYEAAKQHRASIFSDPTHPLPTKTLVYRIVLRPVSADVIVALFNGDLDGLPALIETIEPIGFVE
jgi:hypothetical protein